MMKNRYTTTHTLPEGRFTFGELMKILEEAAIGHVVEMGAPSTELRKLYGTFWMLTRCRVRLGGEIAGPGELVCETCHRDACGVLAYRDFDLFLDGRPVGEAVQAWVIAGVEDRKLQRPSSVPALAALASESGRTDRLGKIKVPADLTHVCDYLVGEKDIDVNGHMNNARYVAVAEGLLPPGAKALEFQVGYIRESCMGDIIGLNTHRSGNAFLVHGTGPSGEPVFSVEFILSGV